MSNYLRKGKVVCRNKKAPSKEKFRRILEMKKVLSFVLVLTLVLGSFSMVFAAPAHTALSDVAGTANEQAITVVNDLGIVEGYTDGTFKPDNNVTRAEFAAMITRALAIPESALAGYTSTSFNDVSGYGWAVKYLGFCESRGIMIGDGNGNAMPGRTVTVNEAMTMILRAIGYTNNSSVLVGSWPSNYVSLGQTLGLYEDVATAVTINRGSAAQVIYNALPVALVQVASDGTTTRIVAEKIDDEEIYRTLLTAGLNCTQEKDVVYYDDDSVISLTEYVGAYANIYRNSDDEIVAVDPISTFLTGELDGTTFTADDVDYRASDVVATTVASFTNADVDDAVRALEDTIDEDDGAEEVTIAVELSGKTIKEIYSIATWTITADALADSDVQDEINEDQKLLGIDFELDDDDEIDNNAYSLLGVDDLSDIAEDDVVYVYTLGNESDSSAKIVKIEVGTETVTGRVTRIGSDSDGVDGRVYTINGNKLYLANNDVATLAVGDEGTARLDYNGDIYDWDTTDGKADNYAVVTGAWATSGRNTMLKLLDKEGNETDYVVDTDDVTTTASITVGSIVTFSLNKSGEIDDLEEQAVNPTNGKLADDGSVFGKTVVKNSVVVFVDDDGDYSLGDIADINTDDAITVGAVTKDGEIAVIVVDADDLGNSDESYGIVKVSDIAGEDADGDDATLFDVIVDGRVLTDVITDLTAAERALANNAVTSGAAVELLKISIDADGVITKLEAHGLNAGDNEYVAATTATVTKISGRVITVSNDSGSDSYRIADNAYIYVWDTDDEEWTVKTSLSSIRNCSVSLYDTDDDTTGFDVVMAYPAE